MRKRNIIVIGTSTGGFEALQIIVKELPLDLDASIFIVWHTGPDVQGLLPDVLNKLGTIKASNAIDGETIKSNHIYVAPPDRHLLIEEGRLRTSRGPRENRFRPAVDPLFRSAAYAYGNAVIGVILSGALDDGTAGLWRIKSSGGIAIVQDPRDAQVPSMPENAMRGLKVDYCLPVEELPKLLVSLSQQKVSDMGVWRDEGTRAEIDIAGAGNALHYGSSLIGQLSPYSCPECQGVLSEIMEENIIRFRCHTGHAYSMETLMNSLGQKIEENLYSAIRGMDETVFLLNHMGDHYAEANQAKLAAAYFNRAREAAERSVQIRNAVHAQQQVSQQSLRQESGTDDNPCDHKI